MEDEPIDVECVKLPDADEAEYQALLVKLDEQVPPVSGKGFDFSAIQGNCAARTAKAIILFLTCNRRWSVAKIADALEVKTPLVSRYLAEAIREAAPADDLELVRQFEERKLDAREEWLATQAEKSCEPEETIREVLDKDGEIRELKTTKGKAGNPAYDKVLIEIAKHRARLLGLEQPMRVQVDKTERKLQINVVEVRDHGQVLAAKEAGLLK
jgi:predicted transcriptional regulator